LPGQEEHFSILFTENGLASASKNFKSNSNTKEHKQMSGALSTGTSAIT